MGTSLRVFSFCTLLFLFGCQVPSGSGLGPQSTVPEAPAQVQKPASQGQNADAHVFSANRQAEDLRIFLADTKPHPGWTPVSLKPSGMLYVREDAIIDRSDLIGIQSATDQAGGGILVLALSDAGYQKIRSATVANPGLRLALVVGKTLLAAPGYAAPIQEKQLAFSVGSAHNAELAARAVAGVELPPSSH